MKQLIAIIFAALLFSGCYTEVVVPEQPRRDYVGITIIQPIWGHYNRRHVYVEIHKWQHIRPLPPAARYRR
jgi:hypothetical protein